VINHSLTGHFDHGQAVLQDLIYYNVFNEKDVDQAQVNRLASYLNNSIERETHADFIERIMANGEVNHLID
jgi:hypothetical protein